MTLKQIPELVEKGFKLERDMSGDRYFLEMDDTVILVTRDNPGDEDANLAPTKLSDRVIMGIYSQGEPLMLLRFDSVEQLVKACFRSWPSRSWWTDDDSCPGCGCRPGDGLTEGCEHVDGCGTLRSIHGA